MVQTSFTITDSADLANDIKLIDAGGIDAAISTGYTFDFDLSGGTSSLALSSQLDAINPGAVSSLTIQL